MPKKSQRDCFIETARQIGADEDEAAFDAKLAVIARQKPKPATPESDSLAPPRKDGSSV